MRDSAVIIEGLSKRYGSVEALREISLKIPWGGITAVLGPNGAGKTTLLRAMCGALRINKGHVKVLGHDVIRDPIGVKSIIGMVPELPYLFPGLTVKANLRLAGRLHGLGGARLRRRVEEVAAELGLTSVLFRKYGVLSKGFKRRVDIAAALIHEPRLLILDEPTGGLDLLASMRLRDIIRGLASQGITIIIATHNVSEAVELADHVVVLVEGRIGFTGSPQRLRETMGLGTELVVVVEGDATRLASYIRHGSMRVEGGMLRIRSRDVLEALKSVIRGSEELGINIRALSMREASWEEIFSRFFRRGSVALGENEKRGGCICEGV